MIIVYYNDNVFVEEFMREPYFKEISGLAYQQQTFLMELSNTEIAKLPHK